MAQLTLDTLYKTYAAARQDSGVQPWPGSLQIAGGSIDVYFSNVESPTGLTDFERDANGPYAAGIITVEPAARFILVTATTGTPVVNEYRVTA